MNRSPRTKSKSRSANAGARFSVTVPESLEGKAPLHRAAISPLDPTLAAKGIATITTTFIREKP
jgi:hypothetical protein